MTAFQQKSQVKNACPCFDLGCLIGATNAANIRNLLLKNFIISYVFFWKEKLDGSTLDEETSFYQLLTLPEPR